MARTPFPARVRSSSPSSSSSPTSIPTFHIPSPAFHTPPPITSIAHLSYPAPYILLVTLSRPESLNCIDTKGHQRLAAVWAWFDEEPLLRVGIVTGEGRAFCAGADLKEWNTTLSTRGSSSSPATPPSGFGGLSRRTGKKPIIAAVNGACLGGGCEMVVGGCDLVLASPEAIFALPEVKVGVVALAGALPRLSRIVGRQRAMEMALTGRNVSAEEAMRWGLVNAVVPPETKPPANAYAYSGGNELVTQAIHLALTIADNSPDSVIVTRAGISEAWLEGGVEAGTERLLGGEFYRTMNGGENMREGVRAFVEKRRPRWVESKL
ncbi:hypothetical protein MMC07_003117 [Pseudocyphellaria aurata]|nr:hypothetical protein [Pseudocyphellaria aurata]